MKTIYNGLLYDTDDMLYVASDKGDALYEAAGKEWFIAPRGKPLRHITEKEARDTLSLWGATVVFERRFGDVPRAPVHPEIAAEREKIKKNQMEP